MAYAVANIDFLIKDLATGILKRLINKNTFRTILLKKMEISQEIQKKLQRYMEKGGVLIPFSDITQILMASSMQETIAQAAISKKQAESMRITAESEVRGAELLKQAGEIMNENKSSINLKYFETLRDIADNWNHTVILPDGIAFGK